jgi:hypothetical protein
MHDSRTRFPTLGTRFQQRPIFLTTPPKRAVPEHQNAESERAKGVGIRGHGVIVVVPAHHDGTKPAPLRANRFVHPAMQIGLDERSRDRSTGPARRRPNRLGERRRGTGFALKSAGRPISVSFITRTRVGQLRELPHVFANPLLVVPAVRVRFQVRLPRG